MAGYAVARAGLDDDWTRDFTGRNTEPVPFFDAVSRSFDDTLKTRNTGARGQYYGAQLTKQQLELEKRLGAKIPQPHSMYDAIDPTGDFGLPDAVSSFVTGGNVLSDADYDKWMLAQRVKNPAAFQGMMTTAEMKAKAAADLNFVRSQAEAGGQGLKGGAASLIGGLGGSLTDPVNLAPTIVTGGAGASRPLLQRMLIQGGINMALEGASEPGKAVDAQTFGGPQVTAGDVIGDIAGAGVGAAGLEGVGAGLKVAFKGASRLVGPHLKFKPDASPEARGIIQAASAFNADVAAAGPDASGAHFEQVRQAMAANGPKPDVEPEKNLGELFDANSGLRAYDTGGLLRPDGTGQAGAGGFSTVEYQGRAIHAGQFDPASLKTDATTFQFKADGDREGVTARLQGVQSWDPASSGKVLVWENAAGDRFIADGHQRLGLAARLVERGFEEKPRLDGYLFREGDGWKAVDVRIVAALKNIREGSGQILDAAKVFRDAPGAAADRSLPVTGEFIQNARALAKLEPEAFGAVVNKVIDERHAVEIGQLAGDRPELHMPMVRLMKEADPSSIDEARALVKEALLDDAVAAEGVQADLFGGVAPQMTTIARAKLKAAVLGQLRRDGRIYAGLVKNADIIEAGGNALARSDNETRMALDLAAAEVVNRLSLRSGPIGEAFADAARRVTEGGRAGDAAKGITQRIKSAVAAGELEALSRAEVIDPPVPPPAIEVDPKTQIEAKPEDADFEGVGEDELQGGLFDDLLADRSLQPEPFDAAIKRLAPCAPGG
jgi:hypothetical protein